MICVTLFACCASQNALGPQPSERAGGHERRARAGAWACALRAAAPRGVMRPLPDHGASSLSAAGATRSPEDTRSLPPKPRSPGDPDVSAPQANLRRNGTASRPFSSQGRAATRLGGRARETLRGDAAVHEGSPARRREAGVQPAPPPLSVPRPIPLLHPHQTPRSSLSHNRTRTPSTFRFI